MTTSELKQIEKLRGFYTEKPATKFDELKALNKKASRPAALFAYIFGTVGALLLGVGMCFAMPDVLGNYFIGIPVGLVGMLMVSVNYLLYGKILRKRRAKYREEILALTDELLND